MSLVMSIGTHSLSDNSFAALWLAGDCCTAEQEEQKRPELKAWHVLECVHFQVSPSKGGTLIFFISEARTVDCIAAKRNLLATFL